MIVSDVLPICHLPSPSPPTLPPIKEKEVLYSNLEIFWTCNFAPNAKRPAPNPTRSFCFLLLISHNK
jgi:hypothetical protein